MESERVTGVMAGSIFFLPRKKTLFVDHQLAPKRLVLLTAPIRKIYSLKFRSTPFFSAATGNFRKSNLDCKSVPAFGTRLELK